MRNKYIDRIFGNILEIRNINERLLYSLKHRQMQSWVVGSIGDIFQQYVSELSTVYLKYGEHQPWGKYWLENAIMEYPDLALFLAVRYI